MDERFAVFGHRGSPSRSRENSLNSFSLALSEGADGFEADVRRLADGTFVLFHDDAIEGRAVETMLPADLARYSSEVTLLGELALWPGVLKILEVKRGGWEEALIDALRGWRNVILSCFDHRVLQRLGDLGCQHPLGVIVDCRLVEAADYTKQLGASWFFPAFRHADADLVASLRDQHIHVVPWTLNTPQEWDKARAVGCYGIITDLPLEAARWRDGVVLNSPPTIVDNRS